MASSFLTRCRANLLGALHPIQTCREKRAERRVGLIAAVPVTAARSAANAEWNALMARYLAADEDENAFLRDVYDPALDAADAEIAALPPGPLDEARRRERREIERRHQHDELDARYEALAEVRRNLHQRLMDTPAPDGTAAAWKLDQLLNDDGSGSTPSWAWSNYAEPITADVRRVLLGEAQS
jgi:hypothetical protein